MKQLLLLVTLLFSASMANAQINITVNGTVSDTNGDPVEGVEILINTDSSFVWLGYSSTVFTLADGTYSDSFEVPEDLTQGAFYVSMVDCNGNWVTETAYWNPTGGTFVFDFTYCVTQNEDCSVSVEIDSIGCTGAGVPLYGAVSYTGSISYAWSNGAATQSTVASVSGTYCLTITDETGCSDVDCIEIDVEAMCGCGVEIELNPAGSLSGISSGTAPFTYQWSTGELTPDIFPTQPGTYCLTIVDAEGCSASACFIYNNTQDSLCSVVVGLTILGLSADASGNAPFTYLWNTGETTQSITPNTTGIYCVSVTDAEGCVATDCTQWWNGNDTSCYVIIYPVQNGGWLQANGDGTAPFTYMWSTGELTASIEASEPGTYCVTLVDANGCQASDCYIVEDETNYFDISGSVFLPDSNNFAQLSGWAYLFSYENGAIEQIDSTEISSTPVGTWYDFGVRPEGEYIVRAVLSSDSEGYDTHLPTYFGDVLWWDEATIIEIPSTQPVWYSIVLIEAETPQGPGLISGSVIEGPNFHNTEIDIRDGNPLADISIFLLNMEDEPITYQFTNEEGLFEFDQLLWGTYKVYVEIPGVEQALYIVTIGPDQPEVNDLTFSITEEGITSLQEKVLKEQVNLFPNPASDQLNIAITGLQNSRISIQITDITGRNLQTQIETLQIGQQHITLDINGLPSGVYFVNLHSGNEVLSKKFVKK